MKRILFSFLVFITIFTFFGCQQVKEQVEALEHPEYEKIEDADGILEKILEHIAEVTPELSFEDGELVDSELGVPHFERVSFLEIEHFNDDDVVEGFIVRPVVDVDNPRLLIVLKADSKEASESLDLAMLKVHSDQLVKFAKAGIWETSLINDNKTVRQGDFLIYVTWNGAEDIVKVFERHVR